MVELILVPSPLLGPASWAPVADLLGARVATVDELDRTQAEGVVLVPHSNAGLHAPRLAERLGARATVYVDAALPAGGASDTALAPPRFLDFLSRLADDAGLLPPWSHWWDDADVDPLFPDAATRAAVEAEQPRLPVSSFETRVPVPDGWADRPSAYLAFGGTYAEEIRLAHDRGWPVLGLPGRHLHQLVAPAEVAAAITDLTGRLLG
ncbi:hypothetical protein [Nocardioides mangrovi]|uniref:Alpha/beta hydrolase n=1 Tax=Nocardioides mangrovi TaxID=2874580 RepID=A0ABS7UHA8_9ACTN|nr:hypothetical protein [Nocardioides mangrovi]MBZ5740423.1 hypothetical protein [Nocardioides mangrovi]